MWVWAFISVQSIMQAWLLFTTFMFALTLAAMFAFSSKVAGRLPVVSEVRLLELMLPAALPSPPLDAEPADRSLLSFRSAFSFVERLPDLVFESCFTTVESGTSFESLGGVALPVVLTLEEVALSVAFALVEGVFGGLMSLSFAGFAVALFFA